MSRIQLVLIFIFFTSNLFAQAPDFKFEHISTKQNLSHNTVTDILQDKKGFLWFTTVDGLNKFDGYTCRIFKHNEEDSNSISINFLHTIYEDSKGYLWITTRDGGINRFDKKTETFQRFKHNEGNHESLSSNKINSLTEDKTGKFWITSEAGLNLLDPVEGKAEHFRHDPDDTTTISHNWLNTIIRDKEGSLWISSFHGLNKFNPATKKNTRFYSNSKSINSLSENFTTSLFEDNEGILWIGTKGGGLNSFNKKTGSSTSFKESMLRQFKALPVNINSIVSFDKDHLLIASEGEGLILFNKRSNDFYRYKHEPNNSFSISSNIVTKIYRDRQGIFWVGTWGGGINKLILSKKQFKRYLPEKFDKTYSNSSSVFAIRKDENNAVWLGTKAPGLIKFIPATGETEYFTFSTKDKPISGIGAIHEDKEGNLWVGNDGLIKINKITGEYTRYKNDTYNENSLSSNDIKCITSDRLGNIWVGTEDGGACNYDPKSSTWTRYFNNADSPLLVRCIYEDTSGNLWFGTYKKGLIKLDNKTKAITSFTHNPSDTTSLSNNDIRHITQTKNGEIWIATYGGGINKFDPAFGHFRQIKEEQGLSNNFTYGILEDEEENLWVSTNFGLTKYGRKNNSFKIYTEEDGLQNNEFNTGAFYKAADGELFFGGVSGFNSFYPKNISENKNIPSVYLTTFRIFDNAATLDTAISFKKSIKLKYSDNFFSIDFAALDFINPDKNQYAYKLEGFDQKWIESGQRRFASYTNLDPGTYEFRVIASNNDGVWNKKGASLTIIIEPPFWMKWWFKAVLILSGLTLLVVTVKYYSTVQLKAKVKELEKEQALQKERERISRDLHDNVGAQLTFLISSIDNLTYASRNSENLDKIKEISSYGRKTMRELRNTVWVMKHEDVDISQLILKLNELKQEVNNISQVNFKINNLITRTIPLSMVQVLNIYRIIQEAVQNVIKHAAATRISVLFYEADDYFSFQVEDNGKGFNEREEFYGNGLSHMKQRCEEIGGEFKLLTSSAGTIINCKFKK